MRDAITTPSTADVELCTEIRPQTVDVLRDEIAIKVCEIVARYAQVKRPVRTEDTLEDLRIDSLSLMELLFDVEEAFDIEIPLNANQDDDARSAWKDVAGAIAAVERLVRARVATA